ncbi:B12-binding domain-containing radical SAM protein [Candidatus Omnitrophota bacterium]
MAKYDMLLVYPESTTDSPVRLTPLSILFPGAYFEKQGMDVAYFDERFDSEEKLVELIKDSKEIGVSAFTGHQSGRAADILEKAKKINPAIIKGVGGHHARILSDEVLAEPFVDKVWTEKSYGEDLFPYNKRTKIHFQQSDMQYFTSRGCPCACSFCSLSSPWVPKDMQDLDRELKTIHSDTGFKKISFSDPNIAFGFYKSGDKSLKVDKVKRMHQLGLIMRDMNVRWDGNMRAVYLTPEMVDALVRSNCYSLEIGCESGNDYFLKKILKKGYGVDAIKQAAKNVKGSGISIMYSFIVNMPRETNEMLRDTFDLIDWIAENDPDARISVYTYAPYPGTPMYIDALKGVDGYPRFTPPTTMKGWANLKLMKSPLYWIVGLCFRKDNTHKNFPGEEWKLIEPYIKLAEEKWKKRDVYDFPCEEVEELIFRQLKREVKV